MSLSSLWAAINAKLRPDLNIEKEDAETQRKTYYETCSLCGANLDPGERCDCTKKGGDAASPESINGNPTRDGTPTKGAHHYLLYRVQPHKSTDRDKGANHGKE